MGLSAPFSQKSHHNKLHTNLSNKKKDKCVFICRHNHCCPFNQVHFSLRPSVDTIYTLSLLLQSQMPLLIMFTHLTEALLVLSFNGTMFHLLIKMALFWVTLLPTGCWVVCLRKLSSCLLQLELLLWRVWMNTPTTALLCLHLLAKEVETKVHPSLWSLMRTVSLSSICFLLLHTTKSNNFSVW